MELYLTALSNSHQIRQLENNVQVANEMAQLFKKELADLIATLTGLAGEEWLLRSSNFKRIENVAMEASEFLQSLGAA